MLDDEDDDEENMGRRNSKAGVQGGYNLLYIGSLKVVVISRNICDNSAITQPRVILQA